MSTLEEGSQMAEQQPVINLEWMDEEVRSYRTELVAAQQRIDSQDEELRRGSSCQVF